MSVTGKLVTKINLYLLNFQKNKLTSIYKKQKNWGTKPFTRQLHQHDNPPLFFVMYLLALVC